MKLKIPAGAFHAYLFDCDGTIVDSMSLHYVAWKSAPWQSGNVISQKIYFTHGAVSRWRK
jgi:beta-phosphoglucomutase-like phosphatase (HAD superfamily)